MTSKRILGIALFSGAGLMSANTFAETHAAHEHGVAQMNLVQIEHNVELEVTSPAFNVFGFEHKPHTEQEKALVNTRLKTMNSGALVLFDTDENCELKETKLKNPFADDHKDHDHEDHEHEDHDHEKHENEDHDHEKHEHEDHDHEKHANDDHDHEKHEHEDHDHEGHEHAGHNHRDIHVEYTFTCKNPQALSQINLEPLFKNWPQLEQVRSQWVIGNLQSSATATRQHMQIKLK